MSIISRLSVVLGLDTAQFNAGLGQAEQGMNKFGAMSGVMKAGVLALGTAFVASAKNAVEFAEQITDLAKANDMSVASVLELTQALTTSGGKVENAGRMIASFTNKVDEAAQGSQKTRDKFKELGVSLSDLGKLSQEDLLSKTINGLSKIEDPVRRNALAFDLLGKAAKGVDFKSLAADLEQAKGTFDKSEESFRKLEKFGDNIAAAWFKAKVNIADALVGMAEAADREMQKFLLGAKKYNSELEAIFAGDFSKGDGKFKPITDTKVYRPDFNVNTKPSANRQILASDEATKVADKIKSQTEALQQQLSTMKLQTIELDGQKSTAEKLKLEFQEGGRYQKIANTELARQAIAQAEVYDAKVKEKEVTRINYELNVRRTQQLAAELEMAQQLAASENIRLQQHKDQQRFRLQDLEAAVQRQNLERSMAGQADIIVDRALKLFDIQQRINQEKRQNGLLSETEMNQWRVAEQALADAQESNRRAQNTFQAGWDRAYNNFVLKAQDSAQLGAQAFNSMTSGIESALDRFVQTGKLSFKELASSIIQDIIRIQMKAQVTAIFGGGGGGLGDLFSGIFGGGGGVSATTGAYDIFSNPFLNNFGFADGGEPPVGRASLVGERGPELFVPKTAGTIIPNHKLSDSMMPPQQTIYNAPVIENMNAIDTQSGIQFLTKNKQTIWSSYQSANRGMPMQRGG